MRVPNLKVLSECSKAEVLIWTHTCTSREAAWQQSRIASYMDVQIFLGRTAKKMITTPPPGI